VDGDAGTVDVLDVLGVLDEPDLLAGGGIAGDAQEVTR